MNITRISATTPSNVSLNKAENVQNQPQVTNPIQQRQEEKKNPEIFRNYFQVSQAIGFTGHDCPTKYFRVKDLEHIPCACCGKDMMTYSGAKSFVSKASEARGKDLENVMNEYMPYFRPTEKAVAEYMMKSIRGKENASLGGAIKTCKGLADSVYVNGQSAVLDEISKKSKEFYGENNSVINLVNESKKTTDSGFAINRENFLEKLGETTAKLNNKDAGYALMDKAIEIPTDLKTIQKFISEYSGSPSVKIAERFVNPAKMTAEHVFPKSLGGQNNTANYVGECADCNNDRGTIPLPTWLRRYPNMPHSSQRYMDEVTNRIAQGEVGAHYDDYPIDIVKTMEKETAGAIKLKVLNPEEIDKMREEKGYKKPDKSEPLPQDGAKYEEYINKFRQAQKAEGLTANTTTQELQKV